MAGNFFQLCEGTGQSFSFKVEGRIVDPKHFLKSRTDLPNSMAKNSYELLLLNIKSSFWPDTGGRPPSLERFEHPC